MSEEVDGTSVEVMGDVSVERYISTGYDIVKYLRGSDCERFMNFVVEEAIEYFKEYGYSPIVGSVFNKYTTNSVDYFFLVKSLAKFIESYVKEGEDLKELVRLKVINIFGQNSSEFMRNGKFFLSVLNYWGYVYPTQSPKYLFLKISYKTKDDLYFVIDAIYISKEGNKKLEDKYKTIANKNLYEELGKGPTFYKKIAIARMKEAKQVFDFEI